MNDNTYTVCKSCGHIHRAVDTCVTDYRRS